MDVKKCGSSVFGLLGGVAVEGGFVVAEEDAFFFAGERFPLVVDRGVADVGFSLRSWEFTGWHAKGGDRSGNACADGGLLLLERGELRLQVVAACAELNEFVICGGELRLQICELGFQIEDAGVPSGEIGGEGGLRFQEIHCALEHRGFRCGWRWGGFASWGGWLGSGCAGWQAVISGKKKKR